MKTTVKFYSGITTIGGVIMEVIYDKHRVLLEIGTAYDPSLDIYDGTVLRRHQNWLKDALVLGQVPAIPGLFDREDLLDFDLLAAKECELDTLVFVSHLHLDHMSAMGMVSDRYPVYISEKALKVEEALKKIGEGVLGHHHNYVYLQDRELVKNGKIEVLPFLEVKDSYEGYAFLIKTPDITIHYTGDLWFEPKNERFIKQLETIQNAKPDILVIETTSFMDSTMEMIYGDVNAKVIADKEVPPGMLSTPQMQEQLLATLKAQKGLCAINFYNREMSDIAMFEAFAKTCNRQLVLESPTAYLYYHFFEKEPYYLIPDTQSFETGKQKGIEELGGKGIRVTKAEINAHPEAYLIQNSYPYLLDLLDYNNKDATYLHAQGMPIGEFDPAYQNLLRILKITGFDYVTFFSKNYFTHPYPCQVKYYAEAVNAPVLIPSHGYHPERLLGTKTSKQFLPELGVSYIYDKEKKAMVKACENG
ncbi:MAG: hypothetical protein LBR25_03555 [Erysipelotrichaceae bacterium]|jgi:ribonuclease J|nr:hypothetical protein [Erysipelotrichaceae bacterium]